MRARASLIAIVTKRTEVFLRHCMRYQYRFIIIDKLAFKYKTNMVFSAFRRKVAAWRQKRKLRKASKRHTATSATAGSSSDSLQSDASVVVKEKIEELNPTELFMATPPHLLTIDIAAKPIAYEGRMKRLTSKGQEIEAYRRAHPIKLRVRNPPKSKSHVPVHPATGRGSKNLDSN